MEKTAPRVALAVMVFLPLAFLGLFFLWPTLRIIGLGLSLSLIHISEPTRPY